jgi:archaemetzincin
MGRIHILPLLEIKPETRARLQEAIHEQVHWPVEIGSFEFDPHYAFEQIRGQYHSSQILLGLRNRIPANADKILAIVPFDLFIPILTFVFGEAQLDGPAAVVSVFRLRPEFYGLPPAPSLVVDRLIKESIHELGHTFGLRHCRQVECVLNASTYVEEIDLKHHAFCPDCAELLKEQQRKPLEGLDAQPA